MTNHKVVEYIRDEGTNRRRGVLLAFPHGENEYLVGYSLCHEKDKFDREFALDLANKRAVLAPERLVRVDENGNKTFRVHKVHPEIRASLPLFLYRCDKYFKGRTPPEWCEEISD